MTEFTKPLNQLLAELGKFTWKCGEGLNPLVNGIVLDSREVKPGNLFVALTGGQRDGHDFIGDAVQNGAVAVVGSTSLSGMAVPYLVVEDTRQALARLSSTFYNHPGREMTVVGVTGTDGKTTTTNLIYKILQAAGLKAGMISTVNAVFGDETLDTGYHVTTPEAPLVQQLLAKMVGKGITHVVLETTSHGLDQKRVAECEFDLAVITNITHEHLDYHGNYTNYLRSKAQLIRQVAETKAKKFRNPKMAVINQDDISFPFLDEILNEPALSCVKKTAYSCNNAGDFFATDLVSTSRGNDLSIHHNQEMWQVSSPLLGAYNAANILAAFSACVGGLEIDPLVAVQGVASLTAVPGRMEVIDLGQDFTAIVDFAHTPNALKVALESARQLSKGRVIAVFGSAGLRDRAKRRMMAEVSINLADLTILTAEDPRTEKLCDILAEMEDAAQKSGGKFGESYFSISDRGDAIQQAVNLAQPGDLVIACGKGHEQSMCFETTEYAWDDRTAMRAALAKKLSIPGPTMPYLPTRLRGGVRK